MKTYIVLIIFLLIFNTRATFAQEWIAINKSEETDEPDIEIITSNSKELTFKVKINGFYNEKIEIENDSYNRIYFPDHQSLNEIGMPALPVINELIGTPPSATLKISIIDSSWVSLNNFVISPVQKSLFEMEVREKFDVNKLFYSSKLKYPDNIVSYSQPMKWREIENRTLSICPFRWYPKEQKIDLMKEFTVKVVFISKELSSKNKAKKLSSKFSHALSKNIFNFNSDLLKCYYNEIDVKAINPDQESMPVLRTTTSSTDYEYLIISPSGYVNSKPLLALKDWKTRLGLRCKIVSTSTAGTTTSNIKTYIDGQYTNYNIKYVLLVGEHTDIPLYPWDSWTIDGVTEYNYSDYWYGCVDQGGDSDYEADVAVGRFSISSLSDLENMVNKTINYEKNPPINNWLEKSLLVAHKQTRPIQIYPLGSYEDCKERIRTATYSITTTVFDTAYGASNATNQDVIDAINDGRGLVNYRGHGEVTGWREDWNNEDPADEFNADEISSLTNATETPVIFSICCYVGSVQESQVCLLENFTRGTNGAVAFLGPTIWTATDANHILDEELYKHIFNDGIYNIGDVLIQANIQAMAHARYGTDARWNAKANIWGGDPSLEIWTDTPSQFTNVSISDNGTNVTVNTGVSGCDVIVCSALDDGVSYFEMEEDVSSTHTFYSVARPYYVTVKKHDYIPYLSDTYIQNKTLTSNAYVSGKDIFVGSNVTSNETSGQVLIEDGANVFFDAKNDVLLDGTFEAELGGAFEIIK